MPKEEMLHVHKSSPFKDLYILLLLIPSLVFVFVIVLYLRSVPQNEAYTDVKSSTYAKEQGDLGVAIIGDLQIPLVIANSELELREGLGNKDSLPDGVGMLFVFAEQNIRPPFWMKGMRFDLDIIWINDGVITQIDRNVPPEPGVVDQDLKLYLPHDPIDYVLEVNAGFSDKYDIEEGDLIDLKFD